MKESQINEWIQRFGWERNPFNFRIYPGLMIGYEEEKERLRNSIESDSKFTLLTGDTGAGKTNMLKSIQREYSSHPVFYMSKPPVKDSELLEYIRDEVLDPGFISRLFNSYSLYNIHEPLNSAYSEDLVILVDEGHEASTEVLEWLRTAMDHIDSLSIVAAGLPEFEERLDEEVNTLYSRATDIVRLESLDKDNTIDLVRKRIEQVGGSSVEPFTQSALLEIYDETGGFPREVLRLCNECIITAASEDKSIIDEDDVKRVIDESSGETNNEGEVDGADESEEAEEETEEKEEMKLTPKQREVYDAVKELEEATSGEIVGEMGFEDYKSRSHAIRSINNILRRLAEQGVVERERRGRNYLYRPLE
ncbi:MAG: AAA family ATPase [Candidatus Nanohaloarchaeota archaeon QJJ-7]|nr:AAA family ATPase [Candidatus Nanohaloarchaeota archaeon QJJ-7]